MEESEAIFRQRLASTSAGVLERTLKVVEEFDFMEGVAQMIKEEFHMRNRIQEEVRKRL